MRGEIIVCKDFRGAPVMAKVWDVSSTILYIHSAEEFDKRMSGEHYLEPVGFPLEDCYEYDDLARLQLEESPLPVKWDKLKRWGMS